MRKIVIILLVGFFPCMGATQSYSPEELERIYNGIENKDFPDILLNNIITVLVNTNSVYDGIPVQRGSVLFYANGSLFNIKLSQNYTVNGITYKAGTNLLFHQNGSVLRGIPTDNVTPIDGVTLIGELGITFYSNEQILAGILANNTTIEDFDLAGNASVSFHENGNLRSGTLITEANPNQSNLIIDSGLIINLDQNGIVTSVSHTNTDPYVLLGMELINGFNSPAGGTTLIYNKPSNTYALFEGITNDNQLVAILPTNVPQDGLPTFAEPVIVLAPAAFRFGSRNASLELSVTDTFDSWTPRNQFVVGAYGFAQGSEILVSENRLVGILVREETQIGGFTYPKNGLVTFNSRGELVPP